MTHAINAEIVATVLSVDVAVGDTVTAETPVVVLESMKMEIPVLAEVDGTVIDLAVSPGDVVHDGDRLVSVDPA